jgi:phage baseplate assembly protein W
MLFPKSLSYPITFNINSGQTNLDSDYLSINMCLALLLTTAKNELLGDPDFGCRLYEFLFEQTSESLIEDIKLDIVENIQKFEKRIIVNQNDIEIKHLENTDRNTYSITITYTLKNSQRQNTTDIILEERENNG